MKILYAQDVDSSYPEDYDRSYLNQFFPDKTCVLFTDANINRIPDIHRHIESAGAIDFVLIDLTHNPVGIEQNMFATSCNGNPIDNIKQLVEYCSQYAPTVVLTTDFNYAKTPNFFYFPVWLWMWSARLPLWYATEIFKRRYGAKPKFWDTEENKTQGMLCMNRTPNWHRIVFYNAVVEKSWFSKIAYTFGNHGHGKQFEDAYFFLHPEEIAEFETKKHYLPFVLIDSDKEDTTDIGVGHPVWSTHTFNIVTESAIDNTLLSEKTAKPFITKMIPIILGPRNTAQHLQDAGLDMFGDIVPWHTWDHLADPRQRISKVVEFLDKFLDQDLVAIYHANKHRVDRNKEFFHSEQFRNNITADLLRLSSSLGTD